MKEGGQTSLLHACLQETGHCRPSCVFAHDAAALQLPLHSVREKVLAVVGSASSGTQLSAAALAGDGADSCRASSSSQSASAGEGVAPGAAAGSTSRREEDWGFAATDGAGASAAGSSAAPSDSGSRGHSLGGGGAGSSGPSQQPKPQQGWRQQRRPLPHEEQLQRLLSNRSRPAELKPCLSLEECGKCYVLGCPYAHGTKERRAREHRCVLRPGQAGRQAAQCPGQLPVPALLVLLLVCAPPASRLQCKARDRLYTL